MVARIVIAAPASGHGKTTVATGLLAAFAARGLRVAPFKVGPDYIDPTYHSLACGRPGRNLDPSLVGEDLVGPLFAHGAAGAQLAVVEGVMGLYDGRIGTQGFASTAHVATLRDRPGNQHVVITGRDAHPDLIELADLVTDMTKVKHPMDAGRKGQQGIEW